MIWTKVCIITNKESYVLLPVFSSSLRPGGKCGGRGGNMSLSCPSEAGIIAAWWSGDKCAKPPGNKPFLIWTTLKALPGFEPAIPKWCSKIPGCLFTAAQGWNGRNDGFPPPPVDLDVVLSWLPWSPDPSLGCWGGFFLRGPRSSCTAVTNMR